MCRARAQLGLEGDFGDGASPTQTVPTDIIARRGIGRTRPRAPRSCCPAGLAEGQTLFGILGPTQGAGYLEDRPLEVTLHGTCLQVGWWRAWKGRGSRAWTSTCSCLQAALQRTQLCVTDRTGDGSLGRLI